jgi:hypothetical protein
MIEDLSDKNLYYLICPAAAKDMEVGRGEMNFGRHILSQSIPFSFMIDPDTTNNNITRILKKDDSEVVR